MTSAPLLEPSFTPDAASVPGGTLETPEAPGSLHDDPLAPTVEMPTTTVLPPTELPTLKATRKQPTSVPPDIKLIRHKGEGYWLEVSPPTEALTVASPVPPASQSPPVTTPVVPTALPSAAVVRQSEPQQLFVPPTQTIGYQGLPAPPSAPVGGYINNYFTVATQSHYRPQPRFPQALDLPSSLDQVGALLRYPLPTSVPITSGFGWRTHPITGRRRFHAGVDLGAAAGTPVLSALGGQVVSAAYDGGYGLRILVQSQWGGRSLQTLYAHLSAVTVRTGQMVQPGQVIGRVGSTGMSTGPHLHFELREFIDGRWETVDSQPLLTAATQAAKAPAQSWQQNGSVPLVMSQPTSGVTMRVALVQDVIALQLASSTPAWILDSSQRPLGMVPAMESLITSPNSKGIQLGSVQLPSTFLIRPSAGGAIAVGGKWYRGTLMVTAQPGGLTVVNWVALEQYLISVVGAEASPSWGMEALKAQAIAARSYALNHHISPAHSLYDLDSSTRYQSYRGIDSEFNTTAEAVAQTRGQVMLTTDGQVLLAQYASTQAITDEAHRGLGMSQWGAASMAQQGYGYREILGHYYQGASLSMLAMGAR
ncbi:SpoIID/LytB domain-containing protein [Phormidium sp. FACHB-592]|uniref:SpoIID/LytB domain-containing protein n=1 Tax=Stenomitos frigidus AS-A4 TaxID=2933935 RepID=A0ABV0KT56_9CYAN|nr:SpoIID/LytB domain-containing protein [Phormidium sp. FACHB-592]